MADLKVHRGKKATFIGASLGNSGKAKMGSMKMGGKKKAKKS